MKSFLLNKFRAVTVAAALCVPLGLCAGEAMSFSNTKSHPDPNLKQKLPNETDKAGLKLAPAGPMDGVTPGLYNTRRRDPRAERKARNAEDEKQNWMVLDPGQLDAEDAEKNSFGGKEFDLDNDRSNKKRDYFFAPPEDKGDRTGRQRQLGRPNGKGKNPPEGKESTRDSDPAASGSDTRANPSGEKEGRPVGDHVSKELDLKDLLAPGKANSLAPAEDKTAKLWNDILGSGPSSDSRPDAGRRDDGSVADGFHPSTGGYSVPSRSPSFGFRNDFAQPPAAANSPGASGPASSGLTAPSTPLVPRTSDSLGGGSAPPTVGRVPTPDNSYGGYGSRQNPYGQGPGSPSSPFGQQPPPRRPAGGNFDIPSRPGYGGR